LIDLYDVDAQWGKSSRGWFKGFKIHASVNQQGLPLRAKVTPANCYDSPILPDISWDLKANYLLADAGYDSKLNRQVAKSIGATPVIAKNRRKRGKNNPKTKTRPKHSRLLRAKRYLVEQFNGHIKANLLKECYLKPKGLAKKSAMVYAALISYAVEGLRALLCDETSLKTVSKYWA
jgi:transposase